MNMKLKLETKAEKGWILEGGEVSVTWAASLALVSFSLASEERNLDETLETGAL